ncbi:MAG: maleylpyruvate isomerase N-terminal domain-containing protein [Acidimicrobiales bacterium]
MSSSSASPEWDTDAADDAAALFGVERSRLLELLDELLPGDWARPSPCPGWSVLDLCGHLLGDDLGWLARQRDQYHGTVPPAGVEQLDGGFARWLDDLQDQWVRAARRLGPRVVTDLLAWSGPQVIDTLAGQDPTRLEGSVSWASPGPVPVWLDQLREVSEHWIHRQQLLQTLGRPSDLRVDLAGPVLDALRWAYPRRLGAISRTDGEVVTIRVSGAVERAWHLHAQGGKWCFGPHSRHRMLALMDLTTEQAWRLLTNNLVAEERGSLHVSGDETIIEALLQTRAIIGTPK